MNNKKIKEYIIDKKIDIEKIIKYFARLCIYNHKKQ